MSEWWEVPYNGKPMVSVKGFPRPLYPPDAVSKGKTPSVDGPDVIAYKRTVSRAGRWPWQQFDATFSNNFSHGTGGNVGDSGVAGVQRQQNIDDTGWIGQATFNTLRSIVIPAGLPHAGEMAMDATAVNLVNQAYDTFGDPEPMSDEDRVRGYIVEFCEIGLAHPSGWNYQQVRPIAISVDPAGHVISDCSGSVIQAFNYARTKSGINVPDPSKQGWTGYGNTNYYEVAHPHVSGQFYVGDLAHYGYDGNSSHVTLCIKPGDSSTADWWSFGSEPPQRRKLFYRNDFLFVVRPPLT